MRMEELISTLLLSVEVTSQSVDLSDKLVSIKALNPKLLGHQLQLMFLCQCQFFNSLILDQWSTVCKLMMHLLVDRSYKEILKSLEQLIWTSLVHRELWTQWCITWVLEAPWIFRILNSVLELPIISKALKDPKIHPQWEVAQRARSHRVLDTDLRTPKPQTPTLHQLSKKFTNTNNRLNKLVVLMLSLSKTLMPLHKLAA